MAQLKSPVYLAKRQNEQAIAFLFVQIIDVYCVL